ncbi:helix-turn-helix domain-containing protein [Vallitalea okinawensis]|uniref:helix-turn-helix domain-containing protein n=1 Tax=Vallitalea okinawensis TaxID=2078660 RepID=UPI000CFDC689|nr:helix-turn-helix domain-containing protein [Vallitalea okinawensis]
MAQHLVLNECPDALNPKMIANILGIGYSKALNLVKYGDMDYIRIGNTYRVSKDNFIEWFNRKGKRSINIYEDNF